MEFELSPFALPADYGDGIVSLAEMKQHLRVLDDDEDDLIGLFRDAAVDMVERYCSLRLAPCTGLVWQAERLPGKLQLGVGPVTSITGLTYLDNVGASQSADVAGLRVGVGGVVQPLPGSSWPSGVAGGVSLTFTAGFTAANRPAALVQAVKMFCAHLFLNREAVTANGAAGGEIPLGFRMLCGAYRMPVI